MTGVRFARSGDVYVAYQVVGDGPIDLVYAQGAYTHLEIEWELPQFRRCCERLAADDRAVGLVDRRPDDQVHLAVLVLEQHEDDPVGGRRALPGDRHAGDGDLRSVRDS